MTELASNAPEIGTQGMNNSPEGRAVAGELLPATRGKMRLNTAEQVRIEMAKVYREMRRGQLDVGKGCKYIYALGQIGKQIETGMIEKQLEQLEKESRQR